jgi:hypothetical protein
MYEFIHHNMKSENLLLEDRMSGGVFFFFIKEVELQPLHKNNTHNVFIILFNKAQQDNELSTRSDLLDDKCRYT